MTELTAPAPVSYKFFCDESCHLEHDKTNIMVLGTVCCPSEQVEKINRAVKQLRHQHNCHNELKWTKLHSGQMDFYKALIDLFIQYDWLKFKATVVINKNLLDHQQFNQGSHNNFYYKMFYYTLRDFISEGGSYRIYLDYMDTHGRDKTKKLCEVLNNHFFGAIEVNAHIIRSHESQLIQLCDLFIGALSYMNREDIDKESKVKMEVINYLERSTHTSLTKGTPPWEEKFNIFKFSPRGAEC